MTRKTIADVDAMTNYELNAFVCGGEGWRVECKAGDKLLRAALIAPNYREIKVRYYGLDTKPTLIDFGDILAMSGHNYAGNIEAAFKIMSTMGVTEMHSHFINGMWNVKLDVCPNWVRASSIAMCITKIYVLVCSNTTMGDGALEYGYPARD